ncbi:MAG: hypothetical protein D3903_13865 [Candidatus Electrothrix sp. GM3_4]|nr:hypothetical protein [Candidatus Electrothrix sp. GM3_4]
MIIKSMSRKKPSFGQLYKYILKEADPEYNFTQNLYSNDFEGVRQEFKQNYCFLKKQKNSNSLYHEIISLTKSGIDLVQQKEKLLEIVREYIQARAKNCLVFGSLHEAKDNIHFHLMISSNELEQEKNHYLSRKQFDQIKRKLEDHVLKKYPELEQARVINKAKKQEGILSRKEYELKKRTGKITKRESIQYRLTQIFNSSPTKEIFFVNLRSNNIEIYTRGKATIGFQDLGDEKKRKYRLKKLGLSAEFNKMSEVLAEELKAEKEGLKKPSSDPKGEVPKQEDTKKTKEQEALEELENLRKSRLSNKTKKM